MPKRTLPILLALGMLQSPAALAQPAPPAERSPAQAAPATPGPAPAAPAPAPAEPSPAERPFELAGVEVAAERDKPQACFRFTRTLPKPRPKGPDLAQFVQVAPQQDITVSVRDRDLCLEGLGHGQRYAITLAAGLPAEGGTETLAAPVTREVDVPDRRPSLAFRGQGYLLPRIAGEGLPLRSVNVERARLSVLRVNDRALVEQIYYGRLNQTMTDFEVGDILDKNGEVVWMGEMAMAGGRNRTAVTPFPIDAVLGTLPPGVYVAVAENAALPVVAWDLRATQWFVVSDLGLTSFRGEDGLTVFARSLSTAKPLPNVALRLVARNNEELGTATSGPDGLARFPKDLLQGQEGRSPQALFANAPEGGFSLLDFGTPAVEVAADGRATGPLDAYLFTDRGAYRPGDLLNLTALLRDADARAVAGRRLAFKLARPDGLVLETRFADDRGAGGYAVAFRLPPNAVGGRWSLTAHADANGPALGKAEMMVGEVAPTRLDVTLTADKARLGPDGKATLAVDGRYLFGGPAARLPGELTVTLRPADNPYPGLDGYRFGLVQRPFAPEKRSLPGFTTGPDGAAKVAIDLGKLPETTRPLEAVVQATVHDVGGRSVERTLALPLSNQAFALGIRPNFAGEAVPEGASVAFDVVAVAPDGQRVARPGLSWELYEEEYQYDWFEADGRWDYKSSIRDKRLTGGTLDVAADKPGMLEEQVKAGRYRLEVFDPATGVASSVRFSAGWWVSAKLGDKPDTVELAVEGAQAKPGGTARVFVRPPYEATVVVALADRAVRSTQVQQVGPQGAFLEVPIPADATGGVHLLATAYAPADPAKRTAPRRAVGIDWLAVDPAARLLSVKLEPPAEARPRGPLSLPVTVAGVEEGGQAHVVVTAVDQGLSSLGGQGTAGEQGVNPAGWFFGRRSLPVELRDAYGRLLGETAPPPPAAKEKEPPKALPRSPSPSLVQGRDVAAVYSGIVTVGADGKALVTLDLPDIQSTLSLTAVAWSGSKVGRGDAVMAVRDPVTATLGVPGFLAPDDKVQLRLAVDNAAGPRGPYRATLIAEGPLAVDSTPMDFKALAPGRQGSATRTLTATGTGQGKLTLTLTGPEGYTLTRTFPITVRSPVPPVARQDGGTLAPGGTMAVRGGPMLDGLRPATATLAVTAGLPLPLDAAGQLLALDTRAYGSSEQLAGRLLPLLYVNDWARGLGLPADADLKERVQMLIDRLAARQRADGAFALWSVDGPAEPWLTPFVLDTLTRAREAGYVVPEEGYRRGLDWLARAVGNSWVEDPELPARAYVLYVAARAKVIDAAPVRFFQETFFPKLSSRLARAQVGAAFALLGDGERAGAVFGGLRDLPVGTPGPRDFGTELRDRAATLAFLAAGNADAALVQAEAKALQPLLRDPAQTSTQERAWLLLAANTLAARSGPVTLAQDGKAETLDRPLLRRVDPEKGLTLGNPGQQPLATQVTASGVPAKPLPPAANGLALERRILDTKGKPVDLAKVRANDLLVVVLEGKAEQPPAGPLLLVDPLPAGFAIENVRLAGSAQLGDLSWLGPLSDAAHVEFREDRFVAALDLPPDTPDFRLVYLARVASAGTFNLPAARVEDLVDATRFARTPAGTLTVVTPKG